MPSSDKPRVTVLVSMRHGVLGYRTPDVIEQTPTRYRERVVWTVER